MRFLLTSAILFLGSLAQAGDAEVRTALALAQAQQALCTCADGGQCTCGTNCQCDTTKKKVVVQATAYYGQCANGSCGTPTSTYATHSWNPVAYTVPQQHSYVAYQGYRGYTNSRPVARFGSPRMGLFRSFRGSCGSSGCR